MSADVCEHGWLRRKWPSLRLRFKPEIIGPPECPILLRWTLGGDRLMKNAPVKVLLHHFQAKADDRDTHDHPRPFLTLVLRGSYEDWVLCPWCKGDNLATDDEHGIHCALCANTGMVLGDRMKPGMIRVRRATHAHRTRVGAHGCWTVVIMGPQVRPWGFWRHGRWWAFRDYERSFGLAFRCETDDGPPGAHLRQGGVS